jgi:hypothetical protein
MRDEDESEPRWGDRATRRRCDCLLVAASPRPRVAFIPHPSSFILFWVVRVERFELITKLILSQPPLPIGLHARKILPIFDCRLPIGPCPKSCRHPGTDPRSKVGMANGPKANRQSKIGNGFTRGGIRTHTIQILNLSSPASWTTRADVGAVGRI